MEGAYVVEIRGYSKKEKQRSKNNGKKGKPDGKMELHTKESPPDPPALPAATTVIKNTLI